jgi:hypothetical protein
MVYSEIKHSTALQLPTRCAGKRAFITPAMLAAILESESKGTLKPKVWDHGTHQCALLQALTLSPRIGDYSIYMHTTFIVAEISSYGVRFEVLIPVTDCVVRKY